MTVSPSLSASEYALDDVETFLRNVIAPQAQTLDQDSAALAAALKALGDRHLLALRVPRELGGRGLTGTDYWQFQAAMTRVSGSLAFLQTQHQSAASFIAGGHNAQLKARLVDMASGTMLVGVGFSHLRRAGAPCLIAEPTAGGSYRLHGTIPWATGWQIFEDLVVGASLADGQSLLALIPFRSLQQEDSRLDCSEPMPLAAMQTTHTVSLQLQHWQVSPEQVIDLKPEGWLTVADRRNVLKSTSLVLGCAQAAVDLMAHGVQTRGWTALAEPQQRLERAVQDCRRQVLDALTHSSLGFEAQVALRGTAIALCGRCVQGAIAMASGGANAMSHPAQRIYRESLVFTVTGQTAEVRHATLQALSQNLPGWRDTEWPAP